MTDTLDGDRYRSLRHELRTPVNHMIGYTELLQEEGEDAGVALGPDLQRIHDAAGRILEIINATLIANRAEMSGEELEVLHFALRTPLNEVIGYTELLQEDAADDGLEWMIADLQRIETAARHLLGLVDEHLPVSGPQSVAEPAPEQKATVRHPVQRARVRQERGSLLVVDDNWMNRDMLSRRLEHDGHRVTVAENGREALAVLHRDPFDLILLDVMMPVMDGYETLTRLKNDPLLRHIPVLMLSALDDMASIIECIEMGADDYLPKPFDPVLLRARIGACLEKKRLRDQEQAYLSAIKQEQERSEHLLLNILPATIAERLKREEGVIADYLAEVTVLFADIVGFTPQASGMAPVELVTALNALFSTFDRMVIDLGLEKIKTIGDAYMVVAGAPAARPDHAEIMAELALAMQETVHEFSLIDGQPLMIRIGMHSGPVVAGVIGMKKFTYDLWGDTVNTASRMESSGAPGAIQVTADTAARLLSCYELEERGSVQVKGKGEMETYLLRGRRTEGQWGIATELPAGARAAAVAD